MAWQSSGFGSSLDWIISGTGLSVKSSLPTSAIYTLQNISSTENTFSSGTNYLYITEVLNYCLTGLSFSITVPSYETFNYGETTNTLIDTSNRSGYLYFSSIQSYDISTEINASYNANSLFGPNGTYSSIQSLNIFQNNWQIQGLAWYHTYGFWTNVYNNTNLSGESLGWSYDTLNQIGTYIWHDDSSITKYPIGGSHNNKLSSSLYRTDNYISNFINYSYFNLSFNFDKISGDNNSGINIYLSNALPATASNIGTLLASITQSGTVSFYGVYGGNYVYMSGIPSTSLSIPTILSISNLSIDGKYYDENNQQFIMATSSNDISINLPGATFSTVSGFGNNINATSSLTTFNLNSNIGNGTFNSGIWENGVWNSGWRYDNDVYPFFSISNFYSSNRSKLYTITINGSEYSASNFSVGDKVSIGNIVSIDINGVRRLIKNYFIVTSTTSNSISVQYANNFPLRSIEIDSPNHRIYVTKNIWLSGVFLNGYFKGIWNYGLFNGFPKITEMYNSHWIDGTFNGGHYYTDLYEVNFDSTYKINPSGKLGSYPTLGLSFSVPHLLNVGDTITIQFSDSNYNTSTTILSIPNDYQLNTNLIITSLPSGTGSVYTNISSGVIQNANINSYNTSTLTSVQSMMSNAVFNYNTWMDVNYYNTSSINIGKPQSLIDQSSRLPYSQNNLFGYPTNDILSSVSTFRDSFSLTNRTYNLGTKYSIYNDYIGDSSTFTNYFGSSGADAQLFIEQGWTYSVNSYGLTHGGITFSRSTDTGNYPLIGEELEVTSVGPGGILDFYQTTGIQNRTNYAVEKLRYTMVQYDLITYSVAGQYSENGINQPLISFNNINVVNRNGSTVSATYLPVYQNVDPLESGVGTKYDYFYNKTNLSMHFRGSGTSSSTFVIDNLKYYEVDMIPFFQYFTPQNINYSVQIPYSAVAPTIDYSNNAQQVSAQQFIDNVSLKIGTIS